ncbi:aminotransferase class I/II-fold pyridoxal phosphate-dependent enzyme [Parasedimentitalea marina]|uniref:Aminotransferase class I/II-fold pyridoxal phosphate-dependent enzyme n=1 Tax=Parasedimentitalea marina TaxID=2483033 RepID=A0A3T0N3U0_9RHOB|nr:aminotransferase class I/II-fold pyridoxal phosphate-dependent enzyme [Parasedimentitalea marina]AZV78649.1 aminotransferase class I/II-fold pyridoxal phosphate-dependent enzyme [Parasedimentitalea marina]
MKVKIHTLFQYLLDTTKTDPEAFIGFSLAESPKLGDFLDDLDPEMSLDWNLKSFRGLPSLRQRVIDQAGLAKNCTADDVLITAGAAEANYLAFMQLVEAGDEVVTEIPGWPQIEVLAKSRGATVKLVERNEAEGWALPLDQLENLVTPKTKLIFLTNPNNPTGKLLSEEELHRIAQIADKVGAWLIVDEVYAGLEWAADRAPSIAGIYERGITTGSVSKALGLQGLRTGWLICRNKNMVMDAIILRENSSEIMNVMGEAIAEVALRPDRLSQALAKARRDSIATLEFLDTYIAAEPKLSWHRPEAGLIGLARLAESIDGDIFAKRLLADPFKTFLLPGSAYGLSNHIRLGVGGGTSAKLDVGLTRMSQLLVEWDTQN